MAKILVVDDEESVRELIRASLQKEGWDVTVVRDGDSAFKAMEKDIPDLILLDIMLPNVDGFTLCAKIRATPELKFIPVIFITAYPQMDSLAKAKKAGAQGFIEKPFLGEELIKQVRDGLAGYFLMPASLKKNS